MQPTWPVSRQNRDQHSANRLRTLHSGPPALRSALDNRLAQLARLDQAALRSGWAELFGRPPSRGISRRLLLYALSHDVQAKAHGGLKPSVRRKLLQVGTMPKLPEPEAAQAQASHLPAPRITPGPPMAWAKPLRRDPDGRLSLHGPAVPLAVGGGTGDHRSPLVGTEVLRAMTNQRRCAIYTRKSTDEGLEQDFNSLHAQREACEAYIKSQTA